MIRALTAVLILVALTAPACAADNAIDCKAVNCESVRITTSEPGIILSIHPRPRPSGTLFGDDDWQRLYAILRALAEHDPAFTDEVLKREDATYYYRDGRALGAKR